MWKLEALMQQDLGSMFLEPLSGYLQLGYELLDGSKINGEAYNFGP